jgi:hypothetical protein
LNPIELLWNTLNGRLPYHEYLDGKPNKDAVAVVASEILDAVTHAEAIREARVSKTTGSKKD